MKTALVLLSLCMAVNAFAAPTVTRIRSNNPFEQNREIRTTIDNKVISIQSCKNNHCQPLVAGKQQYSVPVLKRKMLTQGGKALMTAFADVGLAGTSVIAVGVVATAVTGGLGAPLAAVLLADALVLSAEAAIITRSDKLDFLDFRDQAGSFMALKRALSKGEDIVVSDLTRTERYLKKLLISVNK